MSGVYDPSRLVAVPQAALKSLLGNPNFAYRDGNPNFAYRDGKPGDGWVVMVWQDDLPLAKGTPWEGVLRVAIKHSLARNPSEFFKEESAGLVTWDDLQAIKDRFWPGRIALEVYPPLVNVVNAAAMRWLWVLPVTAALPFNLENIGSPLKGTH